MKKNKLELRLYGLVIYQLTGIQKAIQFGHANDEYKLKYPNDKKYKEWLKYWKTYIILNGGTTHNDIGTGDDKASVCGTMQMHIAELKKNGIKYATFHEPDLNSSLTAVVFVVDERVFNKEKYPDFKPTYEPNVVMIKYQQKQNERDLKFWEKTVGGKQNIFLREFLKPFKLATN